MPNERNELIQGDIYVTNAHEDESDKFIANKRENIKSDLITITHDKLENILLKYLIKISNRNKWVTPLSLFISILLVLLTATFKDTFGISKDIWNSFFILCCLGNFIWFIVSISSLIKNWKESSLDSLINKIKAID
jgi:hypothetical protein